MLNYNKQVVNLINKLPSHFILQRCLFYTLHIDYERETMCVIKVKKCNLSSCLHKTQNQSTVLNSVLPLPALLHARTLCLPLQIVMVEKLL